MENKDQSGVQIVPSDIINAYQIMKLALERGNCFSAEEIVQITPVFSKFSDFVKDVEIKQAESKQEKDFPENKSE